MSFARELRIVVALPSSHLSISASLSLPTSRNGWLPRFGLSRGARSRGTTGTKVGHLALASVQDSGSRAHGTPVGYLVLASAQRPDLGAQGNTLSYLVLASAQRPDPGAQRYLSSNIPFHIWPYPICVLKGQTEREIDKGSHQM
jgi:hypothetical protein